ncbi:MAG: cobyrinate a,c-diamide synthase [Alphaproteobacteria bacterium]|nr:cobyrinate a,c-diamide synthase [Alphaproteobacteria bacterium]
MVPVLETPVLKTPALQTKPAPGLIISAPASGCGKTVLTLALLRALRRAGVAVASAKIGPDYIDPAYHRAASGAACVNLDSWAMRDGVFSTLVQTASQNADLVICEGVMGLFDGAQDPSRDGAGSTAEAAAKTGWPVVLVIDARGQAQSAGALIEGFLRHRDDIAIAGVIFNRVGGDRHAQMLRDAARRAGAAVLGCVPRNPALSLPERYLGLVQASEHNALEDFLNAAADVITDAIDLEALQALARPSNLTVAEPEPTGTPKPLHPPKPLGQTIAVARDQAFAFAYPSMLNQWRAMGAAVTFFSPLGDEAPSEDADSVYLPGGYPELHAGRLASNENFLTGLRRTAERGAAVYGECGGYMTLGETLTDGNGAIHRMSGLLPLRTSFEKPRLHLGYRRAATTAPTPLGGAGQCFTGHEFHYATILEERGTGGAAPLFKVTDARGDAVPDSSGLMIGRVAGSFVHLIDCENPS